MYARQKAQMRLCNSLFRKFLSLLLLLPPFLLSFFYSFNSLFIFHLSSFLLLYSLLSIFVNISISPSWSCLYFPFTPSRVCPYLWSISSIMILAFPPRFSISRSSTYGFPPHPCDRRFCFIFVVLNSNCILQILLILRRGKSWKKSRRVHLFEGTLIIWGSSGRVVIAAINIVFCVVTSLS